MRQWSRIGRGRARDGVRRWWSRAREVPGHGAPEYRASAPAGQDVRCSRGVGGIVVLVASSCALLTSVGHAADGTDPPSSPPETFLPRERVIPAPFFPDGNWWTRATALDVDGDGDIDLVARRATPGGPTSSRTWLNDGHAEFSAVIDDSIGGVGRLGYGVADVDGDGLDDVLDVAGGTLVLHRSRGDGTFDPPVETGLVRGAEPSWSSAIPDIADLDGDGRCDLVVPDGRGGVVVHFGVSDGFGFVAGGSIDGLADIQDIALADADEDGLLDVVVNIADVAFVARNRGDRTFDPPVAVAGELGFVAYLHACDANADGVTDLVGLWANGTIRMHILLGVPGPATWQDAVIFEAAEAADGNGITSVSVGDANGDGLTDVVFGLHSGQDDERDVTVLGDPSAPAYFRATPVASAPRKPASGHALIDMDGDGRDDLVRSPLQRSGWCRLSTLSGRLGSRIGLPKSEARHVAIVDLDGDPRPDLVVPMPSPDSAIPPAGRAVIRMGQADGGYGPEVALPFIVPGADAPRGVATMAVDHDGDGDDDVLLVTESPPAVVVFESRTDVFGQTGAADLPEPAVGIEHVRLVPIELDGDPGSELIIHGAWQGSVVVVDVVGGVPVCTLASVPGDTSIITRPSRVRSVVDGRDRLVMPAPDPAAESSAIFVLAWSSDERSFVVEQTLSAISPVRAAAPIDADRDGREDLALVFTGTLTWWQQNRDGTFIEGPTHAFDGGGVLGALSVDTDGDGSREILVPEMNDLGWRVIRPTDELDLDVRGLPPLSRPWFGYWTIADVDGNGLDDVVEWNAIAGRPIAMLSGGLPCSIHDLDSDGTVGGTDLLALLARWGPVTDPPDEADFDRNGAVDFLDLLILLDAWGSCDG